MKDSRQQIRINIKPVGKVLNSEEMSHSATLGHPSLVSPSRVNHRQVEDVLLQESESTLKDQSSVVDQQMITNNVTSNPVRFNVRHGKRTRSVHHRYGRRIRWGGPQAAKRRVPPTIWAVGGLLMLALLLPVFVVMLRYNPVVTLPIENEIVESTPSIPEVAVGEEVAEPEVSVYLSKLNRIETLPLDDYVMGVVAAEMPAEFESNALTAQAIAARTFIVQRLLNNDKSGVLIEGADVTDTVAHQVYISKETLEKEWIGEKATQLTKLQRAVKDSSNIVMTYKGKPITASFFSTSNGYTENSEDYWNTSIPYLRSVTSPWDKDIAPHYKETMTISQKQFLSKLGLSNISIPTIKNENANSLIRILSTTEGHRIKEVTIGGVKFSGREVREKLGLRSSQFSWETSGNDIVITTYGYGHGVGMSQWGANGMAKEGYTATQILKHYYTGIEFQQVTKLLSKK